MVEKEEMDNFKLAKNKAWFQPHWNSMVQLKSTIREKKPASVQEFEHIVKEVWEK